MNANDLEIKESHDFLAGFSSLEAMQVYWVCRDVKVPVALRNAQLTRPWEQLHVGKLDKPEWPVYV